MSTSLPAKSRWTRRMDLASPPAGSPIDSSDYGSLKKIDASRKIQVSPRLSKNLAPSLITRSLAREATASLSEDRVLIGPSPLAQSTIDSDGYKTPAPIDAYTPPPTIAIPPPRNVPDPFAAIRPAGPFFGPVNIPRFAAPSSPEIQNFAVPSPIAEMLAREVAYKEKDPFDWYTPGIFTEDLEEPAQRAVVIDPPAEYPAREVASIQGLDTGETHLHLSRSSPPKNISYLQPPAYPDHVNISPSDGIPMDCGMMPSRIYPPGQGPSRRRIPSPRGPEQWKVDSGDGQTRVEWVIPFSRDFRPRDAQEIPSGSPDGVCNVTQNFEAREVSRASTLSSGSGHNWHLQWPANPHIPSSMMPPTPPQDDQPFHAHGWTEYLLPDESVYYVHQTYQVVTDVDLSDGELLDVVMAYLENHGDVIPHGQEFWLQDVGPRGGGFVPLRCLVDHTKQSVMFDSLREADGGCERHRIHHGCRDDRLDVKYRYWSFMESHPAHTSLPLGAHQDAMDALSWASTDELLPSHRSAPAPFTREECQSLTALLQPIHTRGETPLHTHTVSKILLRVVCWRQSHFRPDKPLPADAGRDGLRRRGHSTLIRRNVIVGVYACLATAIALCPAQTLVRTAGIGVILLLLFPVAVMAVVWSKVDNGTIVPHARDLPQLKNHTATVAGCGAGPCSKASLDQTLSIDPI
ncbi:hypothetical protein BD779DRAFT_1673485 [Infundibulicybe gibba]|nr:hypothetical protein BD779DRAFT_1673485 [Infundibulicybe gibba]